MVGLRIAAIRKRNNLSQQQFAVKLAEYMQRKRIYTISTVSSWEVGRKIPSMQVLTAISDLFGIPIGYITGEDSTDTFTDSREYPASSSIVRTLDHHRLLPEQYAQYDKKPVFVVFQDMEHESQWGLLNYAEGCVVLMNRATYPLSDLIELFPLESYDFPTYAKRRSKPLSAAKFQNLDGQFWVEVASSDDSIRHEYNGWYIFNKNRTAIVNVSNGLILPIRGFGLSYKCYMEPYDIVD
jgi:transcriptional regulator with XRE-family HTH domain